jgi:hypothetical protein
VIGLPKSLKNFMKLLFLNLLLLFSVGFLFADEKIILEPSRIYEVRFREDTKDYSIISFEPLLPKMNDEKILVAINKNFKRQIVVFKNIDLSVKNRNKDVMALEIDGTDIKIKSLERKITYVVDMEVFLMILHGELTPNWEKWNRIVRD